MAPVVIIGSGLAGYGVAREFRKLDKTTPLLIITADNGGAYSKPMLSNALTKGKTAATLVTADADSMAQQLNAEIRTVTRVSEINSVAHEIEIGAERITYSKLVMALGADPFQPLLQGNGANDVISVNDLVDYDRFRSAIDGKQNVAILGGGLIGCEFANDLGGNGFQVDIIDRNPWPLGRLLPEALGRQLQQGLESLGARWHGEETATTVEQSANGYSVTLESGAQLEVDVVLSAIGLRPRTALAKQAGLTVERGIVVDQYLQSSAEDIYALGDCAEVAGLLLPFVAPLMRASRALAQTLAGNATAVVYPAMPVMLKTPAYPISVLPPPPDVDGQWDIHEEPEAIRALFHTPDGALRGFALGGMAATEGNKLAQDIPGLLNSA